MVVSKTGLDVRARHELRPRAGLGVEDKAEVAKEACGHIRRRKVISSNV